MEAYLQQDSKGSFRRLFIPFIRPDKKNKKTTTNECFSSFLGNFEMHQTFYWKAIQAEHH